MYAQHKECESETQNNFNIEMKTSIYILRVEIYIFVIQSIPLNWNHSIKLSAEIWRRETIKIARYSKLKLFLQLLCFNLIYVYPINTISEG